jgi:hypothetical protein
MGWLPPEYHDLAKACDYAVYSYYTPIALHVEEGAWAIPQVWYSKTTTRHQAIVAGIIGRAVDRWAS